MTVNLADPEFARYLSRYGGDKARAIQGLTEDRFWARFIRAHEPNRGWRSWARNVLAADPTWANGRHRRCTCDEYQH